MTLPLMPKATAVWLIEKTALTFTQIAEFCGMHPLEIQAIADGEVAQGIVGYDPVANGQVTAENIRLCEADPNARLKLAATALPVPKRAKGSRYTPVAKRNDRPDGIAFLLRNYPTTQRSADRQTARAPPRKRSRKCANARIGTAPTSSRAIRSFWGCAARPI